MSRLDDAHLLEPRLGQPSKVRLAVVAVLVQDLAVDLHVQAVDARAGEQVEDRLRQHLERMGWGTLGGWVGSTDVNRFLGFNFQHNRWIIFTSS